MLCVSLCVFSLETGSSPLAALNRGHAHLMSALKNAKPFVNKQIVTFQQVEHLTVYIRKMLQ